MKYLILGGAGFIGTHVAKALKELGHSVTIIDSLDTSSTPIDTGVNLFVSGNILDMDIEPYIENTDVIYFLAGSVGVKYIDENPRKTFDNNFGLMNKLVPLFEKHQKKVIFSSTSEVYGDGPFSESNALRIGAPEKLRWSYAAVKLMTEFYFANCSFPYVVYRFFNVTGPGQLSDYGMVLPRFIKAAKAGEDLVVYGEGNQVRSFCHIDDAVQLMIEAEKYDRETFNIGSPGNSITIAELAQKVIDITGSTSKIRYVPHDQAFTKNHGDIQHRIPDLTKILEHTDYIPVKTVEDIIRDSL